VSYGFGTESVRRAEFGGRALTREGAGVRVRQSIEWPTVLVAVGVHGLWLAPLVLHRHLPLPVVVAALAVAIAWHGSLQHEVIHGHPFHRRAADDALASLPLSLWLPYPIYREHHLAHHLDRNLTDPFDDPESYYVTGVQWAAMTPLGRRLLVANRTLLGRLVIGPAFLFVGFVGQQRDERHREPRLSQWWIGHVVAVGVLLTIVVRGFGLPLWQYLLAAYMGRSLSLVRSFCEHRYVEGEASRVAVVRAGRFFSLLFLHNNLHHTHHERPALAWYELPAAAVELGSDDIAAAGAGWYDGYVDVARRYLLHPFDQPVHPRYATVAGAAGSSGPVTAS
jgi:fatty acid desaturase